jgi:hypothetical protein
MLLRVEVNRTIFTASIFTASGSSRDGAMGWCTTLGMLAVVGFTTYTMIVIRAHASPPMNENNPRNFSQLVTYLNREQYGDFAVVTSVLNKLGVPPDYKHTQVGVSYWYSKS